VAASSCGGSCRARVISWGLPREIRYIIELEQEVGHSGLVVPRVLSPSGYLMG